LSRKKVRDNGVVQKNFIFIFLETNMTERSFVQLKNYPTHLITTEYPFEIKKKSTGRIIKPNLNSVGYYTVWLNDKNRLLHRIIAEQYLENPTNLPEIDHINHIRTDNRLENLRFVSSSLNNRNKKCYRNIEYEYLNQLPNGFELFEEYVMKNGTKGKFKNLFMKNENGKPQFMTNNSENRFRYLHENIGKTGVHFVQYTDVKGKLCSICFKQIAKTQNGINTTQQQINQTQHGINLT
jgi:hypothetical protein